MAIQTNPANLIVESPFRLEQAAQRTRLDALQRTAGAAPVFPARSVFQTPLPVGKPPIPSF
jgi:hypothetical protein